jgi:Carbohydrate binding domain (family 32)
MTRGVLLANINTPLSISDKTAAMSKELRTPRNNRWIFYDADKVLKIGDIINYKIAVEHRGKNYYSGPHSFRVNGAATILHFLCFANTKVKIFKIYYFCNKVIKKFFKLFTCKFLN